MEEIVQSTQLSLFELSELRQCEDVIERGIQTFIEVGNALLEIREKRLYRDYGKFEEYCRDRWGMSRIRAHQLIDAARVVGNVLTTVNTVPANEAQCRPLTVLEPEEQVEVWEEACETAPDGKVTAKHVQNVVDRFKGRTEDIKEDDFGEDWIEWWKEQNLFLVSLPRRGGIVNLTRQWDVTRRRAAVSILRNLGTVASQCADELERNLDGESEDPELDA
jgi:hypothetical protein